MSVVCDSGLNPAVIGFVGALIGAGAALLGVGWQLKHASQEALRQRRIDVYVRLGKLYSDALGFGILPSAQRAALKPKIVDTLSDLTNAIQGVVLVGGAEVRAKALTLNEMLKPLLSDSLPDETRRLEEVMKLLKQAKGELDTAMRAEITAT